MWTEHDVFALQAYASGFKILGSSVSDHGILIRESPARYLSALLLTVTPQFLSLLVTLARL